MAEFSSTEQTVKGLKELNAFLEQLPPKLQKNIMGGALRRGARVILLVARGLIHNVSGELAKSLRVSVKNIRGRVTARIIAGGPKADIENRPIWVEYGTRAHLIRVRMEDRPTYYKRVGLFTQRLTRVSVSTINRAIKIGGRFVGKAVKHPGSRPRPFMRPALDSSSTSAVRAVGEYIKQRLTKEGLNASEVEVK